MKVRVGLLSRSSGHGRERGERQDWMGPGRVSGRDTILPMFENLQYTVSLAIKKNKVPHNYMTVITVYSVIFLLQV